MPDCEAQFRPSRFTLTAVTTSAMTIGTLAPFVVSALSPFIVSELGLSRTQFGSLVTVYFLVGALVSPALGSSVDAVGGWRMMLGLFGIGTFTLGMMAWAPNYRWMLAALALAGMANALANPATNHVIGAHIAAGSRGAIVGIKQSGVQIGAALSGVLLPAAAGSFGWRPSLLGGSLIAAGCAVAAWLARPPRPVSEPRTRRRGRRLRAPVSGVRWLMVFAFLMGSGVSVVTTYIVLFAHEGLGLSAARAGRTLAVLGATGVVARILWARRAEHQSGPTRVLSLLALVASLSSLLLIAAPTIGGWMLLWPAVVAIGASAAAWNSVGMLAIIDNHDLATTGRASGMVLSGFFAGMVISPITFGSLIDATGSYELAWALTAVLFLLAFITVTFEHRRLRSGGSLEGR